MKKKILLLVLMIIIIIQAPIGARAAINKGSAAMAGNLELSKNDILQIDAFVEKQIKDGIIPGMSIAVVKEGSILYKKNFGYSDISNKIPVTDNTLFEIGSNSKQFTALGILILESKGLLNLDDYVSKHIPWFYMNFKGKKVDIKINQLLNFTGGIPFETIADIEPSEADDALENTVKTLVGKELVVYPGEEHVYSTISYDILGLIIQYASGMSYEEFIKESILKPLNLNNTYLFRQEAKEHELAKGYKLGFMRARHYDTSIYRGNTPAGYIISNINDISQFLKVVNGEKNIHSLNQEMIDRYRKISWEIESREVVDSGGSNSNFSSSIIVVPEYKISIAVLANRGSTGDGYIGQTAKGIANIISNKNLNVSANDFDLNLDKICSIITYILAVFLVILLVLLIHAIIQVIYKKRKYRNNGLKGIVTLVLSLVIVSGILYGIYVIPDVIFYGLPWSFINEWGPFSIIPATCLLATCIILFYLYMIFTYFFVNHEEKQLFVISVLSIISGLSYTVLIFAINQALNETYNLSSIPLIYFILGVLVNILSSRIVRKKTMLIVNSMIYNKRVGLINKILSTTYQNIEGIKREKIYTVLNNDTELISNTVNLIISGITNLITVVCCFIYLGTINIVTALISILVIIIAAVINFYVGAITKKLVEQVRDIQNVFVKFIEDMIGGFKELSMNNARKNEFAQDFKSNIKEYFDKRIKAEVKYINVNVINQVLILFCIAFVAFIFPIMFKDIPKQLFRTYVVIFLFMIGPINSVLGLIPGIVRIKVSWNRISELERELSSIESESSVNICTSYSNFELKLVDVMFQYKKEDEIFELGPISCEFKSGSITFITGGNGSGKTTLAKLITGLYTPSSGSILLNGKSVDAQTLRECFSAIFCDTYIFKKLYGIEYGQKVDEISDYLIKLQLDKKLKIEDGIISNLKISTGQRKRLALMISYLEDAQAYVFDEWAAEQDPEFRNFFYENLLQELKSKGKCIIAITHDDRYFDHADDIIKLEFGKKI